MRILTLTQPWASLVAIGAKQWETRSWSTRYRGPIAIHVAKGFPTEARRLCEQPPFSAALREGGYRRPYGTYARELPLGVVLAIAFITDCQPTDGVSLSHPIRELAFGDYSPGRFMFKLTDVHRLAVPIPARGMLGLWTPPAELLQAIESAEVVR